MEYREKVIPGDVSEISATNNKVHRVIQFK